METALHPSQATSLQTLMRTPQKCSILHTVSTMLFLLILNLKTEGKRGGGNTQQRRLSKLLHFWISDKFSHVGYYTFSVCSKSLISKLFLRVRSETQVRCSLFKLHIPKVHLNSVKNSSFDATTVRLCFSLSWFVKDIMAILTDNRFL